MRKFILSVLALGLVAGIVVFFGYRYLVSHSNPHNYPTIGSIPTPKGFERTGKNAFGTYLRSIPLKEKGTKVQLYTGGEARFQILAYAVIDLPLLNNWEQCADVCIRLRSEYLYKNGENISFKDVNGKDLAYRGGKNRKNFEAYLKKVYGMASTYSLSHFLPKRKLKDLQAGDVFVYPARKGRKYGHAVMVVDVARNAKTGEMAFMLAEGNTPARSIHLIRNFKHPTSPWFYANGNENVLWLSPFRYNADEIRHF